MLHCLAWSAGARLQRAVHLLQTRLQSAPHNTLQWRPSLQFSAAAESENKEIVFTVFKMDVEPAPYQHRNIREFVPNNHNIGLTDEQLVTISTKEFNKLLKTSGPLYFAITSANNQANICKTTEQRLIEIFTNKMSTFYIYPH